MKEENQYGFTLIELLVVIAIIGIAAAIATPMFSGYSKSANLRADVQNIYAQLQDAKMMAIKEQQNIGVFFDDGTVPQSLKILSSTGAVLSTTVFSALNNYGQGVATADATTTAGTNWGGNGISFTADTVTFNSRGTANGGYVYVNNQDGGVYAVGVWTTGMIVIRKWNGAGWE